MNNVVATLPLVINKVVKIGGASWSNGYGIGLWRRKSYKHVSYLLRIHTYPVNNTYNSSIVTKAFIIFYSVQ